MCTRQGEAVRVRRGPASATANVCPILVLFGIALVVATGGLVNPAGAGTIGQWHFDEVLLDFWDGGGSLDPAPPAWQPGDGAQASIVSWMTSLASS